jgi:phospholipase C
MDPLINQSQVSDDALTGTGLCGTNVNSTSQGRCGYGPRTPLLIISPYARQNYVDHQITDQSSILRFIEDNWNLGRIGNGSTDVKAGTLNGMFDFTSGRKAPKLKLDPETGLVTP